MSASKMSTNGASLEDCHTNVYSLTELNGLKWKCLTTPLSQRGWTSLENDPVLSAYAKCIQAGVLCAWRRQPPQTCNIPTVLQLPDYRIDVCKELWVFWYSQEEPECLAKYTSHLSCSDDGVGNWSVPGIQYETRTLFFKALHNLIERTLLKRGLVRIGKYFAKPLDVPSADRIQCSPSYVIGISFNFFVHGENRACTNLNIQRQPTIFRLSRRHIDLNKPQPVILGPWSLRATLLPDQPHLHASQPQSPQLPINKEEAPFSPVDMNAGSSMGTPSESLFGPPASTCIPSSSSSCIPNDMNGSAQGSTLRSTVDKLYSEWLQFFGLPSGEGTGDDSENSSEKQSEDDELPKMVLVDVDGVRMWYPTSLIVVQASDDLLLRSYRSDECESSSEEFDGLTGIVAGPSSPSANLPATRVPTPIGVRKRRRKRRETELDGPNRERRNMMYNTMVNGARAAQRFFEEACILPLNSRRRESVESATSGLGLLMSGATNDEDTRWNLTDGMRRKERDNEQCACRQCQTASSSRLQVSSAASTSVVSSQTATPHGTPQPHHLSSPCASGAYSGGGEDTRPGTPKKHVVSFHRRSPSCARSPSPPRSPTWEKRLASINAPQGVDLMDRRSPDWIREGDNHSSLGGLRVSRFDAAEDRYQFPDSPATTGSESPDYRCVTINRSSSSVKPASCKPIYQNLSPSTSRPRSPVNGVSANQPLNDRLFSGSCLNSQCFSPLNLPSGISRESFDGVPKKPFKIDPSETFTMRPLDSFEAEDRREGREFRRPKRRKGFRGLRKIKWSSIENLDVSHVTIEMGEDPKWCEFSLEEPGNLIKQEDVENEPQTSSSQTARQVQSVNRMDGRQIPEQEISFPMLSSYSQASSVSSNASNMGVGMAQGGLGNGIYGMDSEAHCAFLDDCSPSTVAMMDTSSPVEPVVDSVHLSPPASNERVEPASMCTAFGSNVATNLLGRVGGPPSVGDYMIYPTPPSVDASQSQQFSPQNMIVQTNATSIYPTGTAQYMGVMQPFGNTSNICHTLPPQLIPNPPQSDVETCSENSITVKREVDDIVDNALDKSKRPTGMKAVFGEVIKLEVALSGKFAGDIFKGDPLPVDVKSFRLPLTAYADQAKLIEKALDERKKRKRIGRPPDYLLMRERYEAVARQCAPAVRHYRRPYIPTQLNPSTSLPSVQTMSSLCSSQQNNVLSGASFIGNGPASLSASGTTGMMGMMMGGGASVPGSIQNVPGIPPMGMSGMNQQMTMAQMRAPTRPQSLAYAPTSTGQHHSGFLGPSPYGGPPGMLMNHTQMGPMHGGPMGSVPQGMGVMPVQTPPMMGGPASMMHPTMQPQQQQPFQQLSQFVNSANFPGQQGPPNMNPSMYQQQMMYRSGMPGNMTPQQSMQSPGNYMMDSQASTPIEPPPPFSQAMSSQYSSSISSVSGSATPLMYAQSPQMIRSGPVSASSSNQNISMMNMGPRTPQNSIAVSSQMNSPMGSGIFNSRQRSMSHGLEMGPTTPRFPEGKSLVLAVLLQDTVLDLHYDSTFDACPICSCNGNIRAKELGVYITPPEVLRLPLIQQHPIVNKPTSGFYNNTPNPCICGFSAVRHRYLSMKAGLFPEDAKEATDITENQNQPVIPHTIWFDSMIGGDMNFIALLREQTLVRDLGGIVQQVTLLNHQCERAVQFERIGSDSSKSTEYIISDVDQRELPLVFQAACEVACMEMNCRRPPHDVRSVLLHDWGVQIANEMREPREAECMAVLHEIGPLLEETLRIARSAPLMGTNNIVEGPLTWRFFDRKSLKTGNGMEDDSAPEPVPNILVASEKDAIIASPQIIRMWEKVTLEPYDQPKDVLYIAVVPDSLVCVEKSKKYFEDLSRMYEQCRFGRHVPFAKEPLKEGILRVPSLGRATTVASSGECDNFLKQVERHMGDNKTLIARLKAYMQCFETEMARILSKNDYVFSRDTYRAILYENQTQLASSSSANGNAQGGATPLGGSGSDQMPPPAAPGSVSSTPQHGSTPQGPCSVGAPNSVGASSGGDQLTPDNTGLDSTSETTTSLMAEQIADGTIPDDEPGTLPHVIVIYLVNPFLMGAEDNPLVARVVTVALMRAFNALLFHLNTTLRPQLQLEIINLQSIFDYAGVCADFLKDERGRLNAFDQGRLEKALNERLSSMDSMKTVAFSVYSQSRVLLPSVVQGILPKSMTRFGPASAVGDLLKDLSRKDPIFYKVPSKPFILAPPPPVTERPNGEVVQWSTDETVLLVSYCLIGSDWLAATVTDHQGHLLENCLINLRLKPDQKRVNMRYKQSTQIRDSLYRLWSFILGTLATGTKNWRLVIGRVGRIGHGEFKFWTQLLSKPYLKQVSTRMKHACRSCHKMPGITETPGVLSACLVSLEPEAHLRVFPTSFQHDERFGKNSRSRSALTTPDDVSCTHILVFPTSPELNLDHQGASGGAELELDDFSNLLREGIGEEFSELIGNGDLDLTSNPTGPPPQSAGLRTGGNASIPSEYAEVTIENQPLAMGYYVSTAPASELPDWFWSACPSAKRRNPVHLKSSLHLNTPNVQQGDDISSFGAKTAEAYHHPLDSQATVDVLRYVLETYNALSWLNMDFVTGERRSCLPVHIQALMRLCNTVNRLIN